MRVHSLRLSFLLCAPALLALPACTRAVRPDEASVAVHRSEARRELASASREWQLYDPGAREMRTSIARTPVVTPEIDTYYNPTATHRNKAERHAEHARRHQEAAARLLAFESAECAPFDARVRTACPLLGPVARVTDIDHGARIEYAPGTDVAPILSRMRCHLAYANATGYESVSECPLYLRGVEIRLARGGAAIDIVGRDDAVTRVVRREAHELVEGSQGD